MNRSILEFNDVWKSFGERNTKVDALKEINFKINKNSLNLVSGPSGSGKSTLLNLTSLLDVPTKGKMVINGKNTSSLSKSERSNLRRSEIGIIYQRDNLFPYLNILENVMIPMVNQDKQKAIQKLKLVGIDEIKKFPDEISLEDQQRAALARAMINDPLIILADEPTGELDSSSSIRFMGLLKDAAHNHLILMASNNSDLREYSDNSFSLKDGKFEL